MRLILMSVKMKKDSIHLSFNIFNICNSNENDDFKIDEILQDADQPCDFTFTESSVNCHLTYHIRN